MKIDVSLTLSFGDGGGLQVSLGIPSGTLAPANPLKFVATQTDDAGKPGDKVLEVAVGDTSHVYVAVAPPQILLDKAKVSDTIKGLEVKVQEGKYENGAFV